jgi:hypothetical protein
MVSFPRPTFPADYQLDIADHVVDIPPVTMITLPLRSGISVSGLYRNPRPRGLSSNPYNISRPGMWKYALDRLRDSKISFPSRGFLNVVITHVGEFTKLIHQDCWLIIRGLMRPCISVS